MSIAVFGATGNIGSKIKDEALRRGIRVTAVVTDYSRLAPQSNLTIVEGDIYEPEDVAKIASGHDAVVSAFSPGLTRIPLDEAPGLIARAHRSLFAGVRRAGVRLIVVGGVGSLKSPEGVDVVDSAKYAELGDDHLGHTRKNREILRGLIADGNDFEWTYVSPPYNIVPGERTGKFRLGTDQLLQDETGDSRISQEDFAVAIIDELTNRDFVRRRFTVAY
ncbi:MAG: NAD(P)H-binding protein [Bauldia sp.]|nr:NAD(P)H-binding protein [Bauldia sp.]